jgi:hypothetical protein
MVPGGEHGDSKTASRREPDRGLYVARVGGAHDKDRPVREREIACGVLGGAAIVAALENHSRHPGQ